MIPIFNVQLGTSIENVKLLGNEKIFISRKLNGTRCVFIGNKCMTRQGKEYKGLDHIITDLQKIVGAETFVDGELLYKNKECLSDSEAFQKGTGIAMSKDNDKTELNGIMEILKKQYIINDLSKEKLLKNGFRYSKQLSTPDENIYILRFPLCKYKKYTTLEGVISTVLNTGETSVNVYNCNINNIYPPCYNYCDNDSRYKRLFSIIRQVITQKMKDLNITEVV